MPPGPANHPSAPSEGPFSSQQLVSFQLLLINFLKHFPLAWELPADGPGGAPKVGVWGNSQGGVLRRGSIRKARVLEKQKHTQCRPIEGMVKTPGDSQARGYGGHGQRRKDYATLPADRRINETAERVRGCRILSFQLTLKGCICKHTHTHPSFPQRGCGFSETASTG